MKVIKGNIWDFYQEGFICIPTNGVVKTGGELVMGAGLALQAKQRFPKVPKSVGKAVLSHGNNVYVLPIERLIIFPTKHHWREPADPKLIEKGLKELVRLDITGSLQHKVFLPKLGCGLGDLEWREVEPLLDKYLDSRYTVVDYAI